MTTAQKKATARYKSKQVQIQALINPMTEPELAQAWEALVTQFGGSKKKAISWAVLNAPQPETPIQNAKLEINRNPV